MQHGAYKEADREHFFATAEMVEKLIETASPPFDDEWVDWLPPQRFEMPSLPDGWHQVEGWDIALSSGRRYDAWRAGYDVPQVAEAWRALIRSNRAEPAQRRFRSRQRPKA